MSTTYTSQHTPDLLPAVLKDFSIDSTPENCSLLQRLLTCWEHVCGLADLYSGETLEGQHNIDFLRDLLCQIFKGCINVESPVAYESSSALTANNYSNSSMESSNQRAENQFPQNGQNLNDEEDLYAGTSERSQKFLANQHKLLKMYFDVLDNEQILAEVRKITRELRNSTNPSSEKS